MQFKRVLWPWVSSRDGNQAKRMIMQDFPINVQPVRVKDQNISADNYF